MAIPTSLRGYIADDLAWSDLLADVLEYVPDLMWPLSVTTYGQMRHDSHLKATLSAYSLPIRRATWAVDPAGCRPEVAKHVADDLGLPVAGHDEPGAARTRGVSWRDHLRTALSQLVWGHVGFELLAEIDDHGFAHLIELSERMPHTIGRIHVDKVGRFAGITQDLIRSIAYQDKPQIPADRMLWYVHDREGAAWQGSSLLRASYAPWLLKREMLRVHATANRRFGMGVPVIEWDTGVTPSQPQLIAAQAAASAARVGDTAGMSLPPGARLVLTGLSGSAPDTLSFLRFLNREMSRSALTEFLDLGETSSGSRSLGETFVELFLLSLQSIADDIAETVTRQVAARIVAWNWGTDEPVPAVRVADVGSRREVTAEALDKLMSAGAITADPRLEAWVRREYRLPERDQPAPAPSPVTAPPPQAPPPPPAAPAASGRRKTKTAAGQRLLPISAAPEGINRPLTEVEIASGVDFAAVRSDRDEAQDDLSASWAALAAPIVAYLAAASSTAVITRTIATLGSLTVPAGYLTGPTAALAAAMRDLAAKSANRVVEEAATQGVTVPAGVADTDQLDQAAEAIIAVIVSGYANGAARQALLLASPDADQQAVTDTIAEHLVALGATTGAGGLVVSGLVGGLAMAVAAGRMATIRSAGPGVVLTASEVLDGGTCKPCKDIDGTTFADADAALAAYPTGRYLACLGAERCRGMVVMTVPG